MPFGLVSSMDFFHKDPARLTFFFSFDLSVFMAKKKINGHFHLQEVLLPITLE